VVAPGRMFIELDANWYNEWGYAVSNDAALLWVIMLGVAATLGANGEITVMQARRVAPVAMDNDAFCVALAELDECPMAPLTLQKVPGGPDAHVQIADCLAAGCQPGGHSQAMDGYPMAIVLHMYCTCTAHPDAHVQNGALGSHKRWHVRGQKPSLTCEYCHAEGLGYRVDGGSVTCQPGGHSQANSQANSQAINGYPVAMEANSGPQDTMLLKNYQRKNTKKESSAEGASAHVHRDVQPPKAAFEGDFAEVWAEYPRRLGRKRALAAYTARRRAGVSHADLLAATRNYATSKKGEEVKFIMHAGTFFGPAERFLDFVDEVPEQESKPVYVEQIPAGAGKLFQNEAEREAFYASFSLGKVELD